MALRIAAMAICLTLSPMLAGAAPLKVAASLDPDFLRAVSAIRVQLYAVKWLRDICMAEYPESAAATQAGYADWHAKHAALIDEVESKVALIDRQGEQLTRRDGRSSLRAAGMDAMLDAVKSDFRKDMLADASAAKQRCLGYRAWTEQRRRDPEVTHPDWIKKIREYPSN